MIDAWRASGREVAVVGLGKSGVAATRLLRASQIRVYASDAGTGPALAAQAADLVGAGAAVDLGRHDLQRIRDAIAVVVSPGVPPDAPPLTAAAAAALPIVAEVDLGFSRLQHAHCIGITGTNGKTTTTSLLAHVLTTAGVRAEAAGNIGRPLCDVVREGNEPDWIALELSSFQLHDSPHLDPAIGLMTNLAPNHLDRYHTIEDYYGDKALLFRHASARSVWITNGDDAAVQSMSSGVAGRHVRFSLRDRADGWYDRPGRRLMLGHLPLLPREELPLLGDHNVGNALAAALAAREAGADPGRLADGLRTFKAIPHRVEPIRVVDGVLWVNDSKSTNVTSTEVAVAALDRPFVLLLGGRHKGAPYSPLIPLLERRCRAVVAYGEAEPIVATDLGGAVPVERAGRDFATVLAIARRLAQPGDAVLLSPACSSYDMFTNYEERGDRFRAAVLAM